jgi:mono/diheme cytochrome c family protein
MCSSIERALLAAALLALCASAPALAGDATDGLGPLGLGQAPTASEIAGWDIDVRGGDGEGLPPGHGTVKEGEALYSTRCAACHGDFAEGPGLYPALQGGKGSLASAQPTKTVGSYWPYAPTLFDYIRRAMPLDHPGSLTDDQTYAVIAYILNLNDLLAQDGVLDAASLAAIRMTNRDGFITKDPRPDVKSTPCMTNCSGPPHVLSTAAKGVSPDDRAK